MGKRFNLAGGTLMVAAMLVAATVSAEPLPRFEEDLAGMDGEALAELYKQPFVWHLAHGQYINEVCSHDLQFSPGEEQRPVHDAAETERIILEQVDDLRPIIPAIPPPWEWFTVVDAFGNTGLDLFLDAMGGFDSGFFSVPLLHLFDFRGSKLNGNELNYYFFGMAMTHQGFNWWQISAVECVTTQRAVGVPDTLPMQMPTVRAARWQPTRPCGSGVCPGCRGRSPAEACFRELEQSLLPSDFRHTVSEHGCRNPWNLAAHRTSTSLVRYLPILALAGCNAVSPSETSAVNVTASASAVAANGAPGPAAVVTKTLSAKANAPSREGGGVEKGSGSGFGSGTSHPAQRPPLLTGRVSVAGSLPREIVVRRVRMNYGRFRLCYESGRRSNPQLKGRITIELTIGRSGAVSRAKSVDEDGHNRDGTTMPDRKVVQCVVQLFRGLDFPSPESGVVEVRYSIDFSSEKSMR